MDKPRLHVISVPHTITNGDYLSCAFTQKTKDFITMMNLFDYDLIHYGVEGSEVNCNKVDVISYEEYKSFYPNLNLNGNNMGNYGNPYHVAKVDYYSMWINNVIENLKFNLLDGDIICYLSPFCSRQICDYFKNFYDDIYPHAEIGIGYSEKGFGDFRCYTTYTHLSWMSEMENNAPKFNHWVIPYWLDESDYCFSNEKDNYFIYFGRITKPKGIELLLQVSERCNIKIILCGLKDSRTPLPKGVEYLGAINCRSKRKELLSKAKAMFMPSMYFEPFGLSGVESLLSGTPVITTDWASFSEWNLHGYTGYRCRTFSEFCWATENIDNIDNDFCYKWAKGKYTLPVVGKKFDRFFTYIQNVYYGDGFYQEENLDNLDHLEFSDNLEVVYG
jgi:glycosyltransferase involved in cell wall biosynthesis